MDNSAFMKISDGINDGTNYFSGLVFSVDFLIAYFLIEFPSWEILKDKIDVFRFWVIVIEFDNIGVTDIFHDMYFSLQGYLLLLVHLLPKYMQSYFFIIFIATVLPVFFSLPRITFA